MNLKEKTIVLGVTGSISAYKAVDLASKLTQAGARVDVVMTESAMEFITPLIFRNITGRPVVTEMFDPLSEYSVGHVALAEAADIVVIAPATANIIAKLAGGLADDMISCTVLATTAPVVIAPAMNVNMYENSITQENIARLKARGMTFVGPQYGRLASGKMGLGRLVEIEDIMDSVCQTLGKVGDLAGQKIVVTAGGTKEPLDPVRCLTNHSSGKMGYALAIAARNRGAEVTLINAGCSLRKPGGITVIDVCTAQDMYDAVKQSTADAFALIMAAAVADYRPARSSTQKIKRESKPELVLELEHTPDVLGQVRGNFLRVGFAAESENVIENARRKLEKKELDLIVANDITLPGSGIGADNNQVTIIDRDGNVQALPLMPKEDVADKILDRLVSLSARA